MCLSYRRIAETCSPITLPLAVHVPLISTELQHRAKKPATVWNSKLLIKSLGVAERSLERIYLFAVTKASRYPVQRQGSCPVSARCSGQRIHLEHNRYSGSRMGAMRNVHSWGRRLSWSWPVGVLVIACAWNTNGFLPWAWTLLQAPVL